MLRSSIRSFTLGEAKLYWGWLEEFSDVLRGSFAPSLMQLVLPQNGSVGVTCVGGALNVLLFVEVLIVDFDFYLIWSSFTSSSSNIYENFFDMILNRSIFYART